MTRLQLVRHAQSVWNAEHRWQGWADPPLSALGELQALRAARALAADPPALIAASDLQRAARTAEVIAECMGVPAEVVLDAELREYDAGEWTGLRRSEIEARWPEVLAAWDRNDIDTLPGGEPGGPFVQRLVRALGRLRCPVAGGWVLVISHGRSVSALASALGAPPARTDHLSGWYLQGPGPGQHEELRLVEPVSLLGHR